MIRLTREQHAQYQAGDREHHDRRHGRNKRQLVVVQRQRPGMQQHDAAHDYGYARPGQGPEQQRAKGDNLEQHDQIS